MTGTPDPSQARLALKRANWIRVTRSENCRAIRRGDLTIADVLELEEMETMPVVELLRAQRSWGYDRSRKLATRLMMSEFLTVGKLTARQRQVLLKALDEVAAIAA